MRPPESWNRKISTRRRGSVCNQDYNVLFKEQDGSRAEAQIKAFEDTWRWDQASSYAYRVTVEEGGSLSRTMQALHAILGGAGFSFCALMARIWRALAAETLVVLGRDGVHAGRGVRGLSAHSRGEGPNHSRELR